VTKQSLLQENQELKAELARLRHELAELKRLVFGSRQERHIPAQNPEQMRLDFGGQEPIQAIEQPATEQITYTRQKQKHPGRNILPDHLPVELVTIEPPEDVTGLKKIGEDTVDTLDYKPASMILRRYILPKYAAADGKGVIQGRMPERTIPKSIAEPGLLAHVLVQKFVYHMPFYRQIAQFKDLYKAEFPKATLNDWFAACCTLMDPLYACLRKKVLASDYLQADESPIQVQDEQQKGKTHQGYQWVYHAPLLGLVLFEYQKGRGKNGPKEILKHFRGYLQTDGYEVYDSLAQDQEGITLAGCMAHARRYFFKAKDSDATRAETALNYFGQLYEVERHIRQTGLDADQTRSYRQEHSKAVVETLFGWAEKEYDRTTPKSPMGKAIYYLLQRKEKLSQYLEDGRLEIDNNLVENSIRPLALGRKNYLFAGSHDAAQRIAMMYSFFGSCKKQEINPYAWLKAVLERLPQHPVNRLEELLPGQWAKELEV